MSKLDRSLAMSAAPRAVSMAPLATPRGIARGIAANAGGGGNLGTVIENMTAAFDDFQKRHNARADELEAAMNRIVAQDSYKSLGGSTLGGGNDSAMPFEPAEAGKISLRLVWTPTLTPHCRTVRSI